MEKQGKSKVGKVVSVMIILVLIGAVSILFYQNTQNKIEVETKLNELKDEMNEIREQEKELKNELASNNVANTMDNQTVTNTDDSEPDEVPGDMADYYISIGKWKKFEFNTPVGETGKFEIYAEKAVQATGFSGASAHIYYLREGDLYYHNEGDYDTKLASGIIDLKQQSEDIIAVKGNNAKIYTENSYIQYQ